MRLGWIGLCLAVGLAACDTTVRPENGVILRSDRAGFAPYVGTYTGQFEGQQAVLSFSLEGGRAALSVRDADGVMVDLIGAGCQSAIGDLVQTRFGQEGQIKFGIFELDAGACGDRITGTTAEIIFEQPGRPVLRVERDFVVRQVCRRESGGGQDCKVFKDPTYLQGRFDRAD